MRAYRPIQRNDGEQIVDGALLPVNINNGGRHHLTGLKVYPDGMVDCWELVSLQRLEQRVEDGWA